jgi:hypothetical protein
MRNRLLAILIGVIGGTLAFLTPAHALIPGKCYIVPQITPWFTPKTTVDVWLHKPSAGGDQSLSPFAATGFTEAQFFIAISRALAIWNEDGGTSLKLRYRGTTSAISVNGAVVITGRSDVCTNGLAYAYPNAPNVYLNGTIELRKYASGISNCSTMPPSGPPVAWCLIPGSCVDMVAVLLHEFGHQVYNMEHPDSGRGDCVYYGPSVMARTLAWRELKPYDLEVSQGRYGPRSQLYAGKAARLMKSTNSGPGAMSWYAPAPATNTGSANPLFRIASMSQTLATRAFAYVFGYQTVQDGGGGVLSGSRYEHGFASQQSLGTWASGQIRGRAVALASKGTDETVVFYQKQLDGTLYSVDFAHLCYRRSVNGGVSYGSEVCTSYGSFNNGITATYDPYSDCFLVGIRNATQPSDYEIDILTIPASNGKCPAKLSSLGASSFHAPSIACSGTVNGCVIVYEGVDALLSWLRAGVNPTTGDVTVNGSYAQGYYLFHTPSVVYWPQDGSYRLALPSANNAIYSYSMPANGSTWTGTGDIYNNATSQISAGVLSLRPGLPTGKIYAWFNQYW